MSDVDWPAVTSAVETVLKGDAKRIEGEDWKVYLAGTIVRVDINPTTNTKEQ